MNWKIFNKAIITIIIINIIFLIFMFIPFIYANETLYSGDFNLYLNQNGSIGSQLLEYYVAIQYLNVTAINTTANINGRVASSVYTSTLSFTSNTNGDMRILTNLDNSVNHILTVSVNEEKNPMVNQSIFSFSNQNNIVIFFEVSTSIFTKTEIHAIIGIFGIGLFCANPILSYILSDKAKDKFKFFFILMSIGIISVGLAFGFIYG